MQINVLRTKYLLSELERQILSLDNALSEAKKTIEQIETESAYDNLILHDASRAIYNINIAKMAMEGIAKRYDDSLAEIISKYESTPHDKIFTYEVGKYVRAIDGYSNVFATRSFGDALRYYLNDKNNNYFIRMKIEKEGIAGLTLVEEEYDFETNTFVRKGSSDVSVPSNGKCTSIKRDYF